MGLDSYLPLKKSGQSVIDRNLPYRFLRGQPLKGWLKEKRTISTLSAINLRIIGEPAPNCYRLI